MKQKAKTHKATAKRFKLSGSGSLRHNKQGDNAHLKTNKSKAQKLRQKGKKALASKTEANKLIKLMNK
jgi:ribosomal protein L35